MVIITWILTPDLTDINIDNIYEYSCYDDKCIISTFFKDAILDFLEEEIGEVEQINNVNMLMNEKFQYKISFNITNIDSLSKIIKMFIKFKTGRFVTTSIYFKKNYEDEKWIKIWKKNIFNEDFCKTYNILI